MTAAPAAAHGLCAAWGAPEIAGTLDRSLIPEASGLELVPAFPDRLYHHNDSGGGANLYVTDLDGGRTQRIRIAAPPPRDAEDMTARPCPATGASAGTCLYLADIGGNIGRRAAVRIVVLDLPEARAPDTVTPRATIAARYPDGGHNAEAAAIHPDGDLYVLTKTENAEPSRLYRLRAAQLAAEGEQEFEFVAALAIADMLDGHRLQKVTSMDIAPDGTRLAVLTYAGAVEIGVDLSAPFDPADWREDVDWRRIPVGLLPQAEAIAYAADGSGVLYDSESAFRRPGALVTQRCLE